MTELAPTATIIHHQHVLNPVAPRDSRDSGLQQQPRNGEAMELAAFEKGRIQGEMEAMRRMEHDGQLANKQMLAPGAAGAGLGAMGLAGVGGAGLLAKPDILEINRLTWLQRVSYGLGQVSGIAMIVLGIIWLQEYRGGFGWVDGGSPGNIGMFNAFILCNILAVYALANAITHYRILPVNMSNGVNKAIYMFLQLGVGVALCVGLYALIMTSTESNFWSVTHWCWAMAFAVWGTHMIYSFARLLAERAAPVSYENWAEVKNRLGTKETRAKHAAKDANHINTHGANERATGRPVDQTQAADDGLRTVYAPAPHLNHLKTPAANANMGAQVPVAPVNAPRWAELPRTHAEDYFLLPRSKWAVIGFWSLGTALLMSLAHQSAVLAAHGFNWSQPFPDGGNPETAAIADNNKMNEVSTHAKLIGVLGLMTLMMLIFMSYAALPPRTTLVKNGVINEADIGRRASLSQEQADNGRPGHTMV